MLLVINGTGRWLSHCYVKFLHLSCVSLVGRTVTVPVCSPSPSSSSANASGVERRLGDVCLRALFCFWYQLA